MNIEVVHDWKNLSLLLFNLIFVVFSLVRGGGGVANEAFKQVNLFFSVRLFN